MKKYSLLIPALIAVFAAAPLVARPEPELPMDPIPPHSIAPYHQLSELKALKVFDEVLILMQKRLAVAHELAKAKWNLKQPVEEPNQEALVEAMVQKAISYGFSREWAEQFIIAQLDASDFILLHDYEIWTKEGQGDFESVNSLDETRAYLDTLLIETIEKITGIFPFIGSNFPNTHFLQLPLSKRSSDAVPLFAWKRALMPFYGCIHPANPESTIN